MGDGANELDLDTRAPRMNGYRACCVEGSVEGDESVETLDTDEEDLLDSAHAMRAATKNKDEREIEEKMERYFKDYADKDAMAAVDQGLWWISPDGVVKGAEAGQGDVQPDQQPQDPRGAGQGDVQPDQMPPQPPRGAGPGDVQPDQQPKDSRGAGQVDAQPDQQPQEPGEFAEQQYVVYQRDVVVQPNDSDDDTHEVDSQATQSYSASGDATPLAIDENVEQRVPAVLEEDMEH